MHAAIQMSLEIIVLSEIRLKNQTKRHEIEFCPTNYTESYIERNQVSSCAELGLERKARKEGGASTGQREIIGAS